MSEYKIAIKIAGQLESSFGAAIAGAQKGLSSLGGIGKTVGKAGVASVAVAGKALAGTGAALATVGAASIKVGSDFEKAMSSAAATAGASREDYEKLEAAALEMGRTTSKTASESANALEYMALAGWDVDTSISALPSILKMSEASGMDLARTSDLVTDSMSALGLGVDELPKYLNVATRAQNKSNQTAEQLMEAYIGVGGVMNNLGIPIEESAAALGVMANRGIKGSEAGTALNAIMTNLTTGAGQAGKMMEKLGVSAFDSEGNFIGLEGTLQSLNTALSGCTEEERNAALAAIGGKTHVDALNALLSGLNSTTEDGRTEWAALTDELEHAEGALEDMRRQKMDNLAGDMKVLGSAAEYAGIQIYKHLQGSLRGLAEYGTDQINRLSDALADGGFAGLAAEIGPMLADNLELAVEGLPDMKEKANEIFGSFFEGLNENSGRIGTSVASLASAAIQGFMGWYGSFYSSAIYLTAGFLSGLETEIPNINTAFGNMIGTINDAVTEKLPSIIDSAANIVTGLIKGLTDNTPQIFDMAATIVTDLGQGVKDHASEIGSAAVDLIGAIATGFIDHAGEFATAGLNVVEGLATAIGDNLPKLLDTADDIIAQIGTGLDNALAEGSEFRTQAKSIITKIGNALKENGPHMIATGIKLLGELAKGIMQGAAIVISNIPAIVNGIIDIIGSTDWIGIGMQLMNDIAEGIKSLGSAVLDAAREIFTELMHLGEDTEYTNTDIVGYTQTNNGMYTNDGGENYYTAQQLADNGVPGAAEVVAYRQAGLEGSQAYSEGITEGAVAAEQAARETSQNAWNGMKLDESTTEQLGAEIPEGMAEGMASGQTAISTQATELGTEAMTATANGVQDNASAVNAQIDSMVEDMISTIPGATEGISDSFDSAMQDAQSAVESGAAEMPATVQEGASAAMTQLSTELSATGTSIATAMTEASTGLTEFVTQVQTTWTAVSLAFTAGSLISVTVTSAMATSVGTSFTTMQTSIQTSVTAIMAITAIGMTAVSAAVTSGMANIKARVTASLTTITALVTASMASILAVVRSAMAQLVAAVASACSQVVGLAQGAASGIYSAFASINLYSVGVSIVQGLISGMEAMRAQAIATAQSLAAATAQAANVGAKVNSPSKITIETGKSIGEGMIVGMDQMGEDVKNASKASVRTPLLDAQKQLEASTKSNSKRSSIIGDILGSALGRGGKESAGPAAEQAPTFVFSPTYHFEGEAPSKQDIVEANRMSQSEFEKMMKDYLRKNRRTAFA